MTRLLRDVGLGVVLLVYDLYAAVKCHETVEFDVVDGWHVCCLSTRVLTGI